MKVHSAHSSRLREGSKFILAVVAYVVSALLGLFGVIVVGKVVAAVAAAI